MYIVSLLNNPEGMGLLRGHQVFCYKCMIVSILQAWGGMGGGVFSGTTQWTRSVKSKGL